MPTDCTTFVQDIVMCKLKDLYQEFDGCDGINAVWYLIEGDYANAATSAVAAFQLLGSLIGSGIKWGAKGVANTEKIALLFIHKLDTCCQAMCQE